MLTLNAFRFQKIKDINKSLKFEIIKNPVIF